MLINHLLRLDVEKLKYPRAIPFIIVSEFCERFSFYGLRAFLVLYLTRKLMFEEDVATVLYHVFTFLVYLFCLIGAFIADGFLGRFHTILWLSVVYAIGGYVVTAGSVEVWHLPAAVFTGVGLLLIAVGSGGIKPCVAVFGASQFQLPEQDHHLTRYFSMFYFAINIGSLLSFFATPFLRDDVKCFGKEDCFPAAFGLPALLMTISIFIFAFGKFMYKILPVEGNMFVNVSRCIGVRISSYLADLFQVIIATSHRTQSAPDDERSPTILRNTGSTTQRRITEKKLVTETKILLNVLTLFLPLPIFWALFDQQGSRWLIQATKMNGNIGFFTVKPDQMQLLNPLFILISIPLFDYVWYPLLKLIGIRKPLQKMALGGVFAGLSFVLSMIVQLKMDELKPSELNMMWQIPQYIVMTFGEVSRMMKLCFSYVKNSILITYQVMFSVTGLEFAFTQAPESLKSVLQACWLVSSDSLLIDFKSYSTALSSAYSCYRKLNRHFHCCKLQVALPSS